MDGNFSQGMDPIISHIPPAGFVAEIDGVYAERIGKDDEVTLDWLCSPIAVKALGRNAKNEDCCLWIELIDADGGRMRRNRWPDVIGMGGRMFRNTQVHQRHVFEEDLGSLFNKVLASLRRHGFS